MIATKIKNQLFFKQSGPGALPAVSIQKSNAPPPLGKKNQKYCFKAFEANNVTSLFTPQKLVDSCKVNIPQMFI